MSGKLNNYRGSGATAANTLASWSCQLHDSTTNLAGYGTLLVTTSIDAIGNDRKTWTDAAGRTIRSLDQLDKITAVTYDASGNQLTVRDPNNVGADMLYDSLGRNTQRTDTFGDVTKTEYDRAGNAVKQIDAKNKYTLISFDARSRRKSTSDRISAATNFAYTALGQLLSLTDAENQTTANSPAGTVADTDAFTFDRAGRMLTAVSGRYANTVGYSFDPVGRKASESLTISARTYSVGSEYNARNELSKYTYPDGSISDRSYHATGALNQLKLDGSTVSTRVYDDGRRMTSEVLGNGITETRAYRTDNLLSTISYSDTNIGNLSYAWDANKNKTAETIGGVMSGYGFTAAGTTYDFEDRLTGYQRSAASGPALLSQSWSLTPVGDWTSVTTNGTAQARTHGPTHELLTAGGQAVSMDVKGNTTLLPSTLSSTPLNLAYDFDNKMKSVDVDANGSVDVNFQYDALGRRVARVGSSGSLVYVQVDQQTIADYGVGDLPSAPLNRYVYASYIDEPVVRKAVGTGGTVHYYHRNQQYSIYAITTAAGAIAERYAYTAYGQPTILSAAAVVFTSSAINNRYTYTAREWDATIGLHHFRARWMSGLTGRFLTRDPMRYISGYSLYSNYLSQDRVDPSGLQTQIVPVQDLPAITLPVFQIGPIDPLPRIPTFPPIIPPGTLDPPKISCNQFLTRMRQSNSLPGSVTAELKCNPNIFCAPRCQEGPGPGNSSFPNGGRCQVCLNSGNQGVYEDWMGLLIHELTHCNQFRRPPFPSCGCPQQPHQGPNPPPPPLSLGSYEGCKEAETEAYTAQCQYLFPNSPDLQQACLNAGVCSSCKHYPEAPKNCPPWPEQPFVL